MKKTLFRTVAVLAALALLAPLGLVQAQEIQLASHAELNDLYTRLAELESRIAATNVSGCGCTDTVGNGCGNDCCNDCCGCPGFVGGAEILWLKAFNSGGDFGDFNYNEGFRFWIGYQGPTGLGARIRYFDYQQAGTAAGAVVDISSFDAEIYDKVQIGCNWDLYIGGGVRYLDYLTIDNGGNLDDITGVGPVVTAELYRYIGDRSALYAIGRQSIVAGDGNTNGGPATDLTNFVTEMQLGYQLNRDYNDGMLFARVGWEAQWYHEPASNDESVALMGAVLSAGFMR